MKRSVRILILSQAAVMVFFAIFLQSQLDSDRYFNAWIIANNLVIPLHAFFTGIGVLLAYSVLFATAREKAADLPKPLPPETPMNAKEEEFVAPPPAQEDKIVIPPASGLAKFIEDRTEKYKRVDSEGTVAVPKVLPRTRDQKARDESD